MGKIIDLFGSQNDAAWTNAAWTNPDDPRFASRPSGLGRVYLGEVGVDEAGRRYVTGEVGTGEYGRQVWSARQVGHEYGHAWRIDGVEGRVTAADEAYRDPQGRLRQRFCLSEESVDLREPAIQIEEREQRCTVRFPDALARQFEDEFRRARRDEAAGCWSVEARSKKRLHQWANKLRGNAERSRTSEWAERREIFARRVLRGLREEAKELGFAGGEAKEDTTTYSYTRRVSYLGMRLESVQRLIDETLSAVHVSLASEARTVDTLEGSAVGALARLDEELRSLQKLVDGLMYQTDLALNEMVDGQTDPEDAEAIGW